MRSCCILCFFAVFRGSKSRLLLELSCEVNIAVISAACGDIIYVHIGGGEQHFRIAYPAPHQILDKGHTEVLLVGVLESRAAHAHLMCSTVNIALLIGAAVYLVAHRGNKLELSAPSSRNAVEGTLSYFNEHKPHKEVSRLCLAGVVGVLLIGDGLHTVAEELERHFHRSLQRYAHSEEFLLLSSVVEIKMYPIVLKNVSRSTAIALSPALRVYENSACGGHCFPAADVEDSRSSNQKQEVVSAPVGSVNKKVCVVAVIEANIIN